MSSASRWPLLVVALVAALSLAALARRVPAPALLRVCADPNNLPFPNNRAEGFENELAKLVARDLGRTVRYAWWPQRRSFIRTTLRAGVCDVVMGVPSSFDLTLNTRPYYESTYVFVTRRDRGLHIAWLNDVRLRELRIGIPLPASDYTDVPPVDALLRRHIVANVRGYTLGDYARSNPAAAPIDAVVRREVDLAVAWGPLAAFVAARS